MFDWDSLAEVHELSAVAGAAAFHQQDWRYGPGRDAEAFYTGPDSTLEFAEIYANHRGQQWSAAEQATLRAALLYRLAYQARCEHAYRPDAIGPARHRLERFASAFGFG